MMRGKWAAILMMATCAAVCHGRWTIDGQPTGQGAGGGTGVTTGTVEAAVGTYPVFRLDLGGQWTDFELKASTNNFTNLVYYIKSSGTNEYQDDTNVWVYFTDDYAGDVRKWVRASPGTGIWSQLVNPTNSVVGAVIVCPSHDCVVDWERWMSATNNRLVWSYVRYDGIDFERNVTGNKTRWNAAVPVEWRQERIAP
jgi:hypothetical protein